ncbi:MAG: AAA family ATPase, partial [Acidimicrobiia bacterium]
GLSLLEAEQVIQQAALRDGVLSSEDLPFIRGAKAELLEAGGCLELVEADHGTLVQVGGMDSLKEWLRLRGRALEAKAAEYGLESPRGVLVTGIPGCGKSLVAKTLARTWGVPLVLLDPSRLYGPYVGESEKRLHDSLATVEAMAPVVLWVDEIEKGFATTAEGDAGVSRRILGTFLRWMQDRPPGVFLVSTCNDVSALPPELLRKGRFDEIFFVDLPDAEERATIFQLHLQKRKRDPKLFNIEELASESDGFSGAEIEASIVGAMYRSFAEDREVVHQDLLDELRSTSPLSDTRAEDVARLRAWAAGRAREA